MPIKHDDEKRWVEVAFRLHGTPEQLWHAIATGEGISPWFTPTTVEERAGGTIAFEFGPGLTQRGLVKTWDPVARRFCYEEHGWSAEAPPLATEVTVSAARGGTCVVRMVHSLFTRSDQWDDEMESFEKGWPLYFEVLEIYLREFAGQRSAIGYAMTVAPGAVDAVWRAFAGRIGLGGVAAGEQRAAAPGAPPFAGRVNSVLQVGPACGAVLRLVEPYPGVATFSAYRAGDQARITVAAFCYGPDAQAAAARITAEWTAYLTAA